jgi:hypothetical protein
MGGSRLRLVATIRDQACFWFFGTASSAVTQERAERNQFCRFGVNSSR